MDSKTYTRELRKACVKAVFDEIDANRFLGHITGPMDIDVTDLVDVIIDTIAKEAQK